MSLGTRQTATESVAEEEKPQPRWFDWVERNAVPKRFDFPRPKREVTRWQKRGPMTRRDWVRFYRWAAKNATPREIPPPHCPEQPPAKVEEGKKKKKEKKKKTYTLAELLEHAAQISEPREPRDKYIFPPTPDYPYAPKISLKEPAKKDPGRPFQPIKVPKWFHHLENETEFWSTLRFPIFRPALNYKPTANMLRLALPRMVPPLRQHCPIPEPPIEFVAPRRRMTYRQWREHLRRLEYLAKPTARPYYVEMYDYVY
ncbi:PREDICTED: uncharacterized protein LOC108972903 [Bactrocera latifrons]|uniref:Uncharacterized protein n=1 Tax=Bactrocera latifrons TaxID=174628 RepID=A0A0K8VFS7_BACLA|nr:PREDICTED: uncharacterized protein LOC108972903 [Bactrocera latifrons]